MNCPEARERLSDYALEEHENHDGIAGHVTGCPACSAELGELRGVLVILRDGDWGAAPATLSAERRAILEKEAAKPRSMGGRWRRVHPIAAGLAVLAVGAGLLVSTFPRGDRSAREWVTTPSTTLSPSTALRHEPERLRSFGYLAPGEYVPGRTRLDMLFRHPGTNPFVETRADPLSTFGLDVDTASYTLARGFLRRGELPPPEAVRVEEFVNALRYGDADDPQETFAIHVEAAPSPFRPGYHLLRIGLKAREVSSEERKPAVLTFVIDVSGSMAWEDRLNLVRRSLWLLVERLGERDRIGIVAYSTSARVVLEPTPFSETQVILDAIRRLSAEGATNLGEGLDLGYEMAARAFDPGANNRVVLCTDGVANNGVTDPEALLQGIRRQAEKGIVMTAVGVGMGHYNDALLQKLADEGDGQYAYLGDDREARQFFMRDVTGLLEVVARDAKAQVEFDPARVERYRLLGYEKRNLADEHFRDDSVDAGEINSGHTVTVLYELKLTGAGPLGTVRVRHQEPDSRRPVERARPIEERDVRGSFAEATPQFQLAALMARFAEHMRGSEWAKGSRLEEILALADRLPEPARQEPQAQELVALVQAARRLADGEGR